MSVITIIIIVLYVLLDLERTRKIDQSDNNMNLIISTYKNMRLIFINIPLRDGNKISGRNSVNSS